MTSLYLLDSNVYITAIRDRHFNAGFQRFHQANMPRVVMSAVVASEILVGAPARSYSAFRRDVVQPFVLRRRFATPTWSVWKRAIEIDRGLRANKASAARLRYSSFFHDVLIAATARDIGATIITENVKDFDLIGEHIDITVVTPWPGLAAA